MVGTHKPNHVITLCKILLPRPDAGKENSTVLDLANFSTVIIDIPSPDVTLVLKIEPSDDISFMLFLGYKDYPTNDNYVAKTQIPLKNSTEGKSESATSVTSTCVSYFYCTILKRGSHIYTCVFYDILRGKIYLGAESH